MIDRFERWFYRMRRRLSRPASSARWLDLSHSDDLDTPGLLIIQIDGLGYTQIRRALRKGRMPFLKKLLRKEHYTLRRHYSGIPSTTPAVQGMLFYGVPRAVPAFAFRQASSGKIVRMLEQGPALEVQERIAAQGEALLTGGSSYCNIYSGGASESHACSTGWGMGWFEKARHPLIFTLLLLTHLVALIRISFLLILELLLSVFDAIRGTLNGEKFLSELKFIPARLVVCILMRELTVMSARIDLVRGLPAIHLNLLGYDEQAHRRGPSSAFAHFALPGIDRAVRSLWREARLAAPRNYEVWIFSDHGQEDVIPYPVENGRTVQAALDEIFGRIGPRILHKTELEGIRGARGKMLRRKKKKPDPPPVPPPSDTPDPLVEVCALGPIGHVYTPLPMDDADCDLLARRMVKEAKIPIVLRKAGPGEAIAWNARGRFNLPADAPDVLGANHPALEDAARDLALLTHHPEAGQFVISGWRTRGKPISFPIENGAHCGPGSKEVIGFIMTPREAPIAQARPEYVSTREIHEGGLAVTGRGGPAFNIITRREEGSRTLRIMTYNVHACSGMDGRVSTARIARVIMQSQPDIVALQELDAQRERSGFEDQAREIARHLEMDFHFHPWLQLEEELYGDAILSRLPMRLIKSGGLPGHPSRPKLEPRGALWIKANVDGAEVNIINTHFGLLGRERRAQAAALLGPEWLGSPECSGPTVLLGDFNAAPGFKSYRMIRKRLRDAQRSCPGHRPTATWFGRMPVTRIDHIFVGDGITVQGIEVPRSALARVASDHLPLLADLRIDD